MWAFHFVVLYGVRSISRLMLRTRGESKPLTFSKEGPTLKSYSQYTKELIRWSKKLYRVWDHARSPLVMASKVVRLPRGVRGIAFSGWLIRSFLWHLMWDLSIDVLRWIGYNGKNKINENGPVYGGANVRTKTKKEKESVGNFTKRTWIFVLEVNRDHRSILRWENSVTILFLRQFKN